MAQDVRTRISLDDNASKPLSAIADSMEKVYKQSNWLAFSIANIESALRKAISAQQDFNALQRYKDFSTSAERFANSIGKQTSTVTQQADALDDLAVEYAQLVNSTKNQPYTLAALKDTADLIQHLEVLERQMRAIDSSWDENKTLDLYRRALSTTELSVDSFRKSLADLKKEYVGSLDPKFLKDLDEAYAKMVNSRKGQVFSSNELNNITQIIKSLETLDTSLMDETQILDAYKNAFANAELGLDSFHKNIKSLTKDLDTTVDTSFIKTVDKLEEYAKKVNSTRNQPFTLGKLEDSTKHLKGLESLLNYYNMVDNRQETMTSGMNGYHKSIGMAVKETEKLADANKFVDTAMKRLEGHEHSLESIQKGLKGVNKEYANKIAKSWSKSVDESATASSRAKKKHDELNNSLNKTKSASSNAKSGIDSLTSSLKSMAGAYLSFQGMTKVFDLSDSLTLAEGKLSNVVDDVEGAMSAIYQMSMDTRTSYMDNANQIAKMWQLTGGTDGIFDSQDKIIQFMELVNKSFVAGGSGVREINASMYQLIQALSSGRLQGDELRSLGENASYFVNTIVDSLEEMYNAGKDQSEWIDITYNDLKKLGAEGELTSELIVDAIFNASDEIRAAFDNLNPTFEQTFQNLKNQATYIARPILRKLNEMLNSEAFAKTAQSIMKMLAIVMAALTPILDLIMEIGEFMADNWSTVEPIIWSIVGALGTFLTVNLLLKTALGIWTLWTGAVKLAKGAMEGLYTAMAIYNGILTWSSIKTSIQAAMDALASGAKFTETAATYGLLTATVAQIAATMGLSAATAVLMFKILIIVGIILALVAALYIGVWAWNKLTDSSISATGIIVGVVYAAYAFIYDVIITIWNTAIVTIRAIIAGVVAGWEFIKNVVKLIYNIILWCAAASAGAFAAFGAIVHNIWTALWNGTIELGEKIANTFIMALNVAKQKVGVFATAVLNVLLQLGEGINSIFDAVAGNIVKVLNRAFQFVNSGISAYNSTIGRVKGEIDYIEKIEYTSDDGLINLDGLRHNLGKAVELSGTSLTDGFVNFDKYKQEYKDISDTFNDTFDSVYKYKAEYGDVSDAFVDKWNDLAWLEDYMGEFKDVYEYYNKGYDKGKGFEDSIKAFFSEMGDELESMLDEGLMADAYENYLDSLDKGTTPNVGSGLDASDYPEAMDALNKIKDNTDSIADATGLSAEDLECLRELAEQRAINRFTTAEIKITNNMTNNISNEMDMDGVVNYLTEELNKSLVAGSEAANHY